MEARLGGGGVGPGLLKLWTGAENGSHANDWWVPSWVGRCSPYSDHPIVTCEIANT